MAGWRIEDVMARVIVALVCVPFVVCQEPTREQDRAATEPVEAGAEEPMDETAPRLPEREVMEHPPAIVSAAEQERELARRCARIERPAAKIFFSPARLLADQPFRAMAVGDEDQPGARLVKVVLDGVEPLEERERWGGPPFAWSGISPGLALGEHWFILETDERLLACARARVFSASDTLSSPYAEILRQMAANLDAGVRGVPRESVLVGTWEVTRAWDDDLENLYAAWVARLFATDLGAKAGWRPLHQLTRHAGRNILHDHLGLGEDDAESKPSVTLLPDCADLPFFLRAYFAWKLELPFAVHRCDRGNAVDGPNCDTELLGPMTPLWPEETPPVERFNRFIETIVGWSVHSGTVRTLPDDASALFYPIALTQDALRPGTVFADSNGHVLVVTRWVEGTERRMGVLLSVDAHPDHTITQKRFSGANFYFNTRVRTGGFKAFRPVLYQDGALRLATDEELDARAAHLLPSNDQYVFEKATDFHDAVESLINPVAPDPVVAYRARLDLLLEQLTCRVDAVRDGFEYMQQTGWQTVEMPKGSAIFESAGPWGDYSTPGRDIRLLLAIDEFTGFSRHVASHADRFDIPEGKSMDQVRVDLEVAWQDMRSIIAAYYTRSDGSQVSLTVEDILARADRLEQAYNPNDCPEVRWAAPPESEELATCAHRASQDQRERMARYRFWFTERRRPGGF